MKRYLLWVPVGQDPILANQVLSQLPRGRSDALRAWLHLALQTKEERNLEALRAYQAYQKGIDLQEVSAQTRVQLRLSPENDAIDLELVRYFRSVPPRTRGFEAIRLLSQLREASAESGSLSWRIGGSTKGIPDIKPRPRPKTPTLSKS